MSVQQNINLSPQVREQFVQVGIAPEEIWTQIVRDYPELTDAFRNNPKLRAAMFECSQNLANIMNSEYNIGGADKRKEMWKEREKEHRMKQGVRLT